MKNCSINQRGAISIEREQLMDQEIMYLHPESEPLSTLANMPLQRVAGCSQLYIAPLSAKERKPV